MTLTQLPQPVPALVHFFTSGTVSRVLGDRARIVPLVTLWQRADDRLVGQRGRAERDGRAGAGGQHQLLGRRRAARSR